MADITKCGNAGCDIKDGCWRWVVPGDVGSGDWEGGVGCSGFIPSCPCGKVKECEAGCEYWEEKE